MPSNDLHNVDSKKLTSTLTRAGLITTSATATTMIGRPGPRPASKRKAWNQYQDIPPWPLVRWCRVPSPPFVDPTWSDDAKVAFMAMTWRNTIEYLTGKIYWPFRSRKLKKGKTETYFDPIKQNRKILLRAADLMIEFSVQPASWIIFSYRRMEAMLTKQSDGEKCDKRRKKAKSAVPPLNWVFSHSRLEKRGGWYNAVRESYGLEGRTIFTPLHKKLIYDHYSMRHALAQLEDPTQATVDAVVDRFFPTNYKLLLKTVQQEIDAYHAQLKKRALKGEWIWT